MTKVEAVSPLQTLVFQHEAQCCLNMISEVQVLQITSPSSEVSRLHSLNWID